MLDFRLLLVLFVLEDDIVEGGGSLQPWGLLLFVRFVGVLQMLVSARRLSLFCVNLEILKILVVV